MVRRLILNEKSYFGAGAIKEIAAELKIRGLSRVMVATDAEILKLGIVQPVLDVLEGAGVEYAIFDQIKANPTIENVQAGVTFAKEHGAECIVAVGGGSPIDAAKAIAIICTNPEFSDVRSLEGVAPTTKPCLPIIAVSTTSGTAAEVTINYVITDVEKNRKFVCVDPHDIPIVAIVDPNMTLSMPASLAAATGMDALVHAIEGYITRGAWEIPDMLHLKAIEIIGKNLRQSVAGDPVAREQMSIGQYVAGMGFSNVGLGIDHSMAHPLSALYDTPHGVACAIMLVPTLKFNASVAGDKYANIARALGVKGTYEMSREEAIDACIAAIQQLADDIKIPRTLRELGVKEEDIDFLAESAANDACTPGNPKDVTKEDIVEIYKSIF